jgi:WD40 repeat protein
MLDGRDVAHSCSPLITVGADCLCRRVEGGLDATQFHSIFKLPFAHLPIQFRALNPPLEGSITDAETRLCVTLSSRRPGVWHTGSPTTIGSSDKTASLWDLSAKDPAANPAVLRGHGGWVFAVAISPDKPLGCNRQRGQMAGHESPPTTKLYDRTKDEITLSEVERIRL